jgi:hypothetical protein
VDLILQNVQGLDLDLLTAKLILEIIVLVLLEMSLEIKNGLPVVNHNKIFLHVNEINPN